MTVNVVIICRHNDANGKPANQSMCSFRKRSSHSSGNITITQITARKMMAKTSRIINFVRRPCIKSVVALMAVIG